LLFFLKYQTTKVWDWYIWYCYCLWFSNFYPKYQTTKKEKAKRNHEKKYNRQIL